MIKEWDDSPVDASELNSLQPLEKERILNIISSMFGFERAEMTAIMASCERKDK